MGVASMNCTATRHLHAQAFSKPSLASSQLFCCSAISHSVYRTADANGTVHLQLIAAKTSLSAHAESLSNKATCRGPRSP